MGSAGPGRMEPVRSICSRSNIAYSLVSKHQEPAGLQYMYIYYNMTEQRHASPSFFFVFGNTGCSRTISCQIDCYNMCTLKSFRKPVPSNSQSRLHGKDRAGSSKPASVSTPALSHDLSCNVLLYLYTSISRTVTYLIYGQLTLHRAFLGISTRSATLSRLLRAQPAKLRSVKLTRRSPGSRLRDLPSTTSDRSLHFIRYRFG